MLTVHTLGTIQELKGWTSLKHTHTALKKLSHHLQCVAHIDHYCNFLLQQMKDMTIITLTINNSNIFVSLCVKKQDNEVYLIPTSSIPEVEKKGAVLFEFPTYYHEKTMTHYESFFQKEVKVSDDNKGVSRILLLWIQRSFFYRYNEEKRGSLSILHSTDVPSLRERLHYWLYFLYTSVKRRQC